MGKSKRFLSADGPYKLVIVEWEDSGQPIPAWQWIDDYKVPKSVACLSVGYIIAETELAIALAPNLGDVHRPRAQASGIIHIPRRAICSIRKLTCEAQYDGEQKQRASVSPSS